MMTKKDYELIALAVNKARALEIQQGAKDKNLEVVNYALGSFVGELGNLLMKQNERFDFDKFAKACGCEYEGGCDK